MNMNKFIELTHTTDGKFLINLCSVAYFRADESGCRVYFIGLKKDDYLYARSFQESYEQVKALTGFQS